jgi:hypothetical protein
MHRRATVWILGLSLLLAVLFAAPSCGSSKPATGLGAGCSINSDCNGALICAFGLCHVACVTSKDCTSGATCLPPGVCELPQETTCSSSLPCVTGLTCADDTCRAPCSPGVPSGSPGGCPAGQTCSNVAGTTVCLDESGDGGVGTPDGSSSGDGSGVGDGGDAGGGGDGACPSPETTFGPVAQGDSNPSFGSGVGALGVNGMYIFSGYTATAADGGIATAVYVQAFDPKTGASNGPSQSLFTPPQLVSSAVASGITVWSAAASPAGDLALVYVLHDSPGTDELYVAFLSPSTGDGGTAGVQLQRVVLLKNGALDLGGNVPAVFWSNASQTFVVSYQYSSSFGIGMSVNKLYADGQVASGGVSPAPFVGDGIASQSCNGNVGESGSLLAVSYFPSAGAPTGAWITILDESGNLVGSPTDLAGVYGENGAWAGVAGTAQGFVYFYDQQGANALVGEAFVSTSPDGGIVGGDISGEAGIGEFPGFTLTPPATAARVIADDVGTGGHGGVGAALLTSGGVTFVYVHADGVTHEGPVTVSSTAGGDSIWMANLNGSFAVSFYDGSTNSTQVVASGICP